MDNRDKDFGDEDRMTLDDPLGIAREPVSPDGSIRASNDEESVRRRRKRALGEDEPEETNGMGAYDSENGVGSSIDMGGGGDGNQIKRSR